MTTFFADRIVRKARKPHRCGFCGTTIEIGATYNEQACKYDGRFYTWREHQECFGLAKKWDLEDDENVYPESCVRDYVNELGTDALFGLDHDQERRVLAIIKDLEMDDDEG